MATTPNLGLELLTEAQDQPDVPLNYDLRKLDALVQLSIIDKDLLAPPVGAADGARYIVAGGGGTATGLWASHERSVAVLTLGEWTFYPPAPGWRARVLDENADYVFGAGSPASWVPAEGSVTPQLVEYQVALSDMTTALTTGATKGYMRAPRAFTLTDVRGSLGTASSGSPNPDTIVDVNVNGATILSTKLQIPAGSKTSTTGTPVVITTPAIPDDALIEFDIDLTGGNAAGLIVTLLGHL